jgi:hypothetical protein
MNFVCGKCFAVSSHKAWDKATTDFHIEVAGTNKIVEVLEALKWKMVDEFAYTCPVCSDNCADPMLMEYE